jgi:hypothetical protein
VVRRSTCNAEIARSIRVGGKCSFCFLLLLLASKFLFLLDGVAGEHVSFFRINILKFVSTGVQDSDKQGAYSLCRLL